jgi:hypothetical protein
MPADLLADAFADPPVRSALCPLGVLLADASDLARQRMTAALANVDDVPISWIVGQIRLGGKQISKDVVSQHRRGCCRCSQGR